MRFQISHSTTYTYHQPVLLEPHLLHLSPRAQGEQKVLSFSLQVSPLPAGVSTLLDLNGNTALRVWFKTPTNHLNIQTLSEVETGSVNPFNYLLHPWATRLPMDYPSSLLTQLHPFWASAPTLADPSVVQWAHQILNRVEGETLAFLSELNQTIYQSCQYLLRETGDPWPAARTWQEKAGSCRDLAVLWVEACRAVGLAARFVSGYATLGNPSWGEMDQDPFGAVHHLHAWGEVYLPGAGWRGYDPTQGLAVADAHVALAAAPLPRDVVPVLGSYSPAAVVSEIAYQLQIQAQG